MTSRRAAIGALLLGLVMAACAGDGTGGAGATSAPSADDTSVVTTTIEATTTTQASTTTTTSSTTTTTVAATTTTEVNPFAVELAGIRHGRPDVPFHGRYPFMLVMSETGSATFTLDAPGGQTLLAQITNATADTVDVVHQMGAQLVLWQCEDGDDEQTYGYLLQGTTLRFVDLGDDCEQRRDFLTTTAWTLR